MLLINHVAECLFELYEMTKHKLVRRKKLNFFRVLQDYTVVLIRRLPIHIQLRIYSDSILSSLLLCDYFYGNSLAPPLRSFSPTTAFGIALKYIATKESIKDFIIEHNHLRKDVWFIGITKSWREKVGKEIIQIWTMNKRRREKMLAWEMTPVPEDVKYLIIHYI